MDYNLARGERGRNFSERAHLFTTQTTAGFDTATKIIIEYINRRK